MRIFHRRPLRERFWKRVNKTETCWLWTGAHGQDGYGRVTPEGPGVQQCNYGAHRASWELHNGPIPIGKQVLHRCDTRDCVRPDHLFLGTLQSNVADMVNKGRNAKGERSPIAKLTAEKVRTIRQLHIEGVSMYRLGQVFGVGPTTIGYIVRRETWKHV
jgi:hypothetical protein